MEILHQVNLKLQFKYTLIMDHKPLVWFQSTKNANSRILKWMLKLAEYTYDVVYKAGKMTVNADELSRNSIKSKFFK